MTDPLPARQQPVRSVQRAIDILALFSERRPALTLREIVDATGLAKTTVLRLLRTLTRGGLVWTQEDGRYVVGPALLRWGGIAARTWELPAQTREMLHAVAERGKETVHVYVRRDLARVCIAQFEGPQTLRHVAQVGDELPLWAGAVAKVLAIGIDDETLAEVARRSPWGEPHRDTLRRWRAEADRSGFAVSHGEREEGLSSVAVPLHRSSGAVVAALSFGGPSGRFTDDRIPGFVTALRTAASRMNRQGIDKLITYMTT